MNFRSHFGQTCSLLIFRSVRSQKTHARRVGCCSVADKPSERTQKSRPKGTDVTGKPHEPVEIPVPKREDFDRLLKRAAKGNPKKAKG
jgi:hypothetical protein